MDTTERLKLFYNGQAGNISWDTTVTQINKFIDENQNYDFSCVEQVGQMTILHYYVPKAV